MDYYVYQWTYPNGTPFYIGLGRGGRFENNRGRNAYVKRIVRGVKRVGGVVIKEKIAEGLTLVEAQALEIKLIHQYGRRWNKTGILANVMPGGETGAGPLVLPEGYEPPKRRKRRRKRKIAVKC